MAGTPPDSLLLEGAGLRPLQDPSPHHYGTSHKHRTEFYNKFQRAADTHDRDTIKKYDEDLNTALIFAGLFSAVTSAFIVDIQSKLEPDFQEMSHALLRIIASATLNHAQADTNFPEWKGPDPNIVRVQTILYSSLFASLLAALIAMLGKQWLNFYALAEFGSLVERNQLRVLKMEGLATWKFGPLMECLPIILQIALLLLSCGLAEYLYPINKVVSGSVIGFTSFGLLFYLIVAIQGLVDYGCPFQTPISLLFRWLVRLDNNHQKYLGKFTELPSQTIEWVKASIIHAFSRGDAINGDNPAKSLTTNASAEPLPFSNEKIDWLSHTLNSRCVGWIVRKPMDADVTMAIANFIPEIVWHSKTLLTPLETLYDTILECFDYSSGLPVLKPDLREKAYLSAKAILHASIQHECLGGESRKVLGPVSARYLPLGSIDYSRDWDLESTFGILDRVFGGFESPYRPGPMLWSQFSFTDPHHAWMGHILLQRTVGTLKKGRGLPDDVTEFLRHSVGATPLPELPVVADCLFIAGSVLGIDLHKNDLLVVNKSPWIIDQIEKIFEKLADIFEDPTSQQLENVPLALGVVVSAWRGDSTTFGDVSQKCSQLFQVIAQSPVSPADQQERMWPAARLALCGAYKLANFFPQVDDPRDIFTFLDYYLNLATGRDEGGSQSDLVWRRPVWRQEEPHEDIDEGILCALRALTDQSILTAYWDNEDVNLLVLRTILYTFQGPIPSRLSKVALSLLPLICDRWCNTQPLVATSEVGGHRGNQTSAFHAGLTNHVRSTLLEVVFQMVGSSHLRQHVTILGQLRPLELFVLVQEYCEPLKGCLENSDLVDEILGGEDPDAVAPWLAILWLSHRELIPQVREKAETFTVEAVRDERRTAFDACLQIMDSGLGIVRDELRKAQDESEEAEDELERGSDTSMPYDAQRTRKEADVLRMKIRNLEQTKASLAAYLNDPDSTPP